MKKIYLIMLTCVLALHAWTAAGENRFYIQDFSIAPGATADVAIMLDNEVTDFASFQADMYMPEGLELVQQYNEQDEEYFTFSLTTRARSRMAIGSSEQTDGAMRLMLTQTMGSSVQTIKETSGALVTFQVKAADNASGTKYIRLGNIIFTTATATQYTLGNSLSTVTVTTANNNITFADDNVKALCVDAWDTDEDGELSMAEAAAVTDLEDVFTGKTYLTSFDELAYFTGLTSIGDNAFNGCFGLTSITIPNSVTSIGTDAFKGCSGLTSITIPNSVTSISNCAFIDCSGLTSVTIPNSVTSIGDGAFGSCSSLTSITIPNSVTGIGYSAFSGCSSLASITIPNSVTWLGAWPFEGCSGLTSINVALQNPVYDSRNNCNAIIDTRSNTLIGGCKNTVIPNTVTAIGERAFQGCSGLTSITIPKSVTSIGGSVFQGCSGLTSMTVDSDNTKYDSREDCNAIIETATNTLIAGFKNSVIPNSVTSIGDNAFNGCSGLTSITIPNSVASIGGGAFNGCSGLTSITIPNSVTSIGDWAFNGCSGLTSITIPNSVTSIGDFAFCDCSGLTSVTVGMEIPANIGGFYTFYDECYNATLYVPSCCKAAYAAAEYWNWFREIVEIKPEHVEATDISQLTDAIYIEPVEAASGGQLTLSVKMKNTVAIQTIQFDLYLPDGVTVVANEDGELITASKERINKFSYFQSSIQSDGALRLLAQATTTNVPAGDGEICRVTVNVQESMEEGDYPMLFRNIMMTENNNTSHSPDPNIVRCKLTVLHIPGDTNNDGDINAIDFNMIGNYILGNHSQANFSFRAADFNNDGDVNAIDFNMVANYILYGNSAPSSRATRKEETLDPQ